MIEKPEMSRHEASWHEHLAGMRAADKARQQGSNAAAVHALATATAGPQIIGGYTLAPAAEGTIWTLKRLAMEFQAWADAIQMPAAETGTPNGTREILELGLTTLVFVDALECWGELERGNLEGLILRAEKLMWETPLEISRQLENHFTQQMAAIRDLSPEKDETPGKPQPAPASGTSAAMPTPAPAQASQP